MSELTTEKLGTQRRCAGARRRPRPTAARRRAARGDARGARGERRAGVPRPARRRRDPGGVQPEAGQGRGVRQGRVPGDLPGHPRPGQEPGGRVPPWHLRLAPRRCHRRHPHHGDGAQRARGGGVGRGDRVLQHVRRVRRPLRRREGAVPRGPRRAHLRGRAASAQSRPVARGAGDVAEAAGEDASAGVAPPVGATLAGAGRDHLARRRDGASTRGARCSTSSWRGPRRPIGCTDTNGRSATWSSGTTAACCTARSRTTPRRHATCTARPSPARSRSNDHVVAPHPSAAARRVVGRRDAGHRGAATRGRDRGAPALQGRAEGPERARDAWRSIPRSCTRTTRSTGTSSTRTRSAPVSASCSCSASPPDADAEYEWQQHVHIARDAGITDAEIERIAEGPRRRWVVAGRRGAGAGGRRAGRRRADHRRHVGRARRRARPAPADGPGVHRRCVRPARRWRSSRSASSSTPTWSRSDMSGVSGPGSNEASGREAARADGGADGDHPPRARGGARARPATVARREPRAALPRRGARADARQLGRVHRAGGGRALRAVAAHLLPVLRGQARAPARVVRGVGPRRGHAPRGRGRRGRRSARPPPPLRGRVLPDVPAPARRASRPEDRRRRAGVRATALDLAPAGGGARVRAARRDARGPARRRRGGGRVRRRPRRPPRRRDACCRRPCSTRWPTPSADRRSSTPRSAPRHSGICCSGASAPATEPKGGR